MHPQHVKNDVLFHLTLLSLLAPFVFLLCQIFWHQLLLVTCSSIIDHIHSTCSDFLPAYVHVNCDLVDLYPPRRLWYCSCRWQKCKSEKSKLSIISFNSMEMYMYMPANICILTFKFGSGFLIVNCFEKTWTWN